MVMDILAMVMEIVAMVMEIAEMGMDIFSNGDGGEHVEPQLQPVWNHHRQEQPCTNTAWNRDSLSEWPKRNNKYQVLTTKYYYKKTVTKYQKF